MSVRFDATTDRITYAASNPPDPSSGFTITAWAMVRVDTNNNATLFRPHVVSGDSTSANCATSSDGTGGPNYFTAGGTVTATTNFVVDSWRKIAVTCSSTTGHVYVAAVGGATEHVSGTVGGAATPTGITLGGRSAADASEAFDGRLAYVRVWSTQLSQAQVEAEWASTTPVVTSGLWADWPLTVHTDLTDHSGNGRDLVAGATATTTEADPPVATLGTGSGVLGALTGSATGVRTVLGAAAGSLGSLTGAGSAARTVLGTAQALLGGSGTAAGVRAVAGAGTGSLGALTGRATVAAPAGASTGGGWGSLYALNAEVRQILREEAARPPVACPNDGEPLRTGPRGELYCPFACGWRSER
jgi:hypothetical protein